MLQPDSRGSTISDAGRSAGDDDRPGRQSTALRHVSDDPAPSAQSPLLDERDTVGH